MSGDQVREPVPRMSRRMAWSLVAVVVSCVALCVVTLIVSVEIGNARLRQFCALVVSTDDAYQAAPPARLGATGQRIAADMHALRRNLDCPREIKEGK